MKHRARDYWSFVEKLHDITDYVQELEKENARLQRLLAETEEKNAALVSQRSTLRRLIKRGREDDPVLEHQLDEMRGIGEARRAA
ncbi:MAG: hypothetical protein GY719_28735 [bacterium]|nr:hypothetical protein [bacterium]